MESTERKHFQKELASDRSNKIKIKMYFIFSNQIVGAVVNRADLRALNRSCEGEDSKHNLIRKEETPTKSKTNPFFKTIVEYL